MELAKEIFIILENKQMQSFVNIITGDGSWFMCLYTQNSQQVISKDDLTERTNDNNLF